MSAREGRYAVFGGQIHYGYQEGLAGTLTLNGILAALGEPTGPVVHFSDFLKTRVTRGQYIPRSTREIALAAQRFGIGHEKFMVNLGPDS